MNAKLTARTAALIATSLAARAQATLHAVAGNSAGEHLGRAVAFLSDVDGDGVADFAVGAPTDDPQGFGATPGSVKVFSGKTGALLQTILGDGVNSEFGRSLAAVPDVDGDGHSDLLIGAPSRSYTKSQQGAAYVYTSSTGQKWRVYFGASTGEMLGTAVANLGDTDFDGIDDYAIGAPFADHGGFTDNGRVTVYSGADGALLHDWWQGVDDGQLGAAIGAAGDVNGDGGADYLIGAPAMSFGGLTRCGVAFLFTTSVWPSQLYHGCEDFEQFGRSFAALGDLTGDGLGEFAIGTPHYDGSATALGRVCVFSPAASAPLFEIVGKDGWRLGSAMACVGDFDGDGARDLAVGAPGYDDTGAVSIVSGASGAPIATLVGDESGAGFGIALDGGRDLNGDKHGELVIGASAEDAGGAEAGVARLILAGSPVPQVYGGSKLDSSGCTPHIGFSGAASASLGDNFHVTASGVDGSTSGMLFWSLQPANVPFHGGAKLIGNPVVRTGVQSSGNALGACGGHFDFHFSHAYMQSRGLAAGSDVFAQYWYRDAGAAFPNNVGLSDALNFRIVM